MLASDIYDLSCRAYNGSDEARGEWFAVMAPLARAVSLRVKSGTEETHEINTAADQPA